MKPKANVIGIMALGTIAMQMFIPKVTHATTQYAPTTISITGESSLHPQHVLANDPWSGKPTSWVPVYYLQVALKSVGVQSAWNGNTLNILSVPYGWNENVNSVPEQGIPSAGQMQFSIGGNQNDYVRAPKLVVKDPASNVETTYVPIYYANLFLNQRLQMKTSWTGSTWTMIPQKESISNTKSSTVVLTLQNDTSTSNMFPPLPIPAPAPVSVPLPLYPSSTLSNQDFTPIENVPVESYVQDGKIEYMVPAPLTTVEGWYKQAFKNSGYVGGGAVSMLSFSPQNQPPYQNVTVEISFKTDPNNQTLVAYWVTDDVLPLRPSSSYVPTDVESVNISMATSSNTNAPLQNTTVTILKPTIIKNLIQAINSLTTIEPNEVVNGTEIPSSEITQRATLTFHENGGNSLIVQDAYFNNISVVTVSNIPFQDPNNIVWTAILSASKQGETSNLNS